MTGEVRPRFGNLTLPTGERIPLVFRPTDDPTVFAGVHAGTEQPVRFVRGATMSVDVLGAGQAVTLLMDDADE